MFVNEIQDKLIVFVFCLVIVDNTKLNIKKNYFTLYMCIYIYIKD